MNSKLWLTLAAGAACLTSSACTDFKVEKVPGNYSLVVVQDEPAGDQCSYGGKKIISGIDMNRDGILAVEEVVDISYVCTGKAGTNAWIVVSDIAAGEEGCQFGGKRIETGTDKNGNGEIDENEVGSSWVVCSGTPVSTVGRIVKVSTFLNQSCALLSDETVQCWGQSGSGMDGSSAPVKVGGIYKATDVAAGCALESDGIVRCWDGLSGSPRAVEDLRGVKSIAGSNSYHMCAVLEDTSAVCWGLNSAGQLGNGSFVNTTRPQPVVDANGIRLMGVKKIVPGNYHTCALMDDTSVRCWGWNEFGQLGLGEAGSENFYSRANVVVDAQGTAPLGQVTDLALGYGHTCALLSGGGVKCWGSADVGQLGPSASESKSALPLDVAVTTEEGVTVSKIAAGYGHTCAALSNGSASCWGWNVYGQLGAPGVERFTALPSAVQGLTGVSGLVLGEAHSCASLQNGGFKCWGNNSRGQFGNGVEAVNQGYDPAPDKVVEISDAAALTSGYLFNCALTPSADEGISGNIARCWGNNDYGQLGNGGFGQTQRFPVTVQNAPSESNPNPGPLSGLTKISAGYIHACALTSDDSVVCWGDNSHLQLGSTSIEGSYAYPVMVGGLYNINSLVTGHAHTCVTMLDGSVNKVKCWGYNEFGQLGTGSTTDSPPMEIADLNGANVSQLALGRTHSCALLADGTVKCWGNNTYGQMGTSGTDALSPMLVTGISGATQIAAGHAHNCAVLSEGAVWCWGSNIYGESGQEIQSGVNSVAPTQVTLDKAAVKVVSGYQHTCALLANGTVQCWGSNSYGQLGRDLLVNSGEPVEVSGINNVRDISAGQQHTCALIDDGQVKCWGGDRYGQLGRVNGNPVPVDAAFVIQ